MTESILRKREEMRRQALLAADVAMLRTLMSASLTYIHSNGQIDNLDSFLGRIARQDLQYQRIDLQLGSITAGKYYGLLSGTMNADIVLETRRLQVQSRYEAVWTLTDTGWLVSDLRSYVERRP